MKINSDPNERGSVLVTALITITILTLICATSLYVASQNTNAGMQTASWQQALSGAESAVDLAFNALNNASASGSAWRGWRNVQGSPPSTQPIAGSGNLVIGAGANPTPTPGPSPGYYYYLVSNTTAPPNSTPFPNLTFSTGTEGNNSVSGWMTIDTAGLPLDKNGNQWYRVRATGNAGVPGLKRVSNQRLDDNLRKFSLIFDRKSVAGTGTISSPVASRRIEVIAAPQTKNVSAYGVVLRNSIYMNGNTLIDSFDSSSSSKSTNGQYDSTKQQSHANVATVNSTGSNLNNEPIYGSLAYSGPVVKGTGGVTGTISTPFNASPPDTSNPLWTALAANTYSAAPATGILTAAGTDWGSAAQVKINGDFITNGAFTITGVAGSYIEIWVTGNFQTKSTLTQNNGVHVKWYVDGGSITTDGGSYINNQNGTGTALYTTFIGVGAGTASIGGNSNFIAVLNAPGYDVSVKGTGDFSGSIAANSLSMVGSGSIHYDEALAANGINSSIANYSIASWFEDNSDPGRKDQNGNAILTY
jgi:Tfp pilus assembly protein PilX